MSKLRDNLEEARKEYGQARYRGDLADDVFAGATDVTPANPWWRRCALLAAAAAVAIAATLATRTLRTDVAPPVAEKPTNEVAMPAPEGVASNDPAQPVDQAHDQGQTDATVEVEVEEAFTVVPGSASTDDAIASASFVPSYVSMSFSVPSSLGVGSIDEYEQQRIEQDQNQGDGPSLSSPDNSSREQS